MAEFTSQRGFLDVQGAPLYYEVAGQGPTLLLLHAGIADSRMWDQHFAVFAQQYQTIRYDLRGFGQSAYPARSFANHEDPAALLRHFQIEKAHVIGVSFGGRVALDFALAHPEMVTSLVLVAPDVLGYPPTERLVQFGSEEEALLEKGDLEAATELNLRIWVDGPLRTPEQVDPLLRQKVHDMQYHTFTMEEPEGADYIALEPPAAERLTELALPLLVIVGDLDLPEKLAVAQDVASRVSGAQYLVLPNAAHMVTMELPEQFDQALLDFFHEQ